MNYQGSEIDATQDVAYGSTAVRPDNPVRKGYTFDGWYTTPDYDGAAFDFGTLIEESMVLYAKWSEIATDGLLFEEHGSDYKVTGYAGIETEVYIPSQHDGKLVFIIDEGAFE